MDSLIQAPVGRCDLCTRTIRLQFKDKDTGWTLCGECGKDVYLVELLLRNVGLLRCANMTNNRGVEFP